MENNKSNIETKKLLWIGGIVIAVILAIGLMVFMEKEYVASIDGEKISMDELNELLVSQYGAEVLDTLIIQKVIEMEMDKQNIEVTEEEIDAQLAKYEEYYGGKEAFETILNSSGIDLSLIKKDIKLHLGSNKLMEDEIEVTEEEIQSYFDENKETFGEVEQVEASHILVDDEEIAEEVISKLNDGEDFATMAKEYSIDTSTAENGGELGFIGKGEWDETLEEVAFALEVGTYSKEPVETDDGFHIIKVTDHKEAKEAVYDEAKDEIKEILFNQKADSYYSIWIVELMEDYEIENYLG